MSAVSAIETLRAVGAEAISQETHISQDNINKLLDGDFEAFSPIQFNGFVTIIEREYDVDLTEWRAQFAQSVPEPEVPLAEAENDPFTHVLKAKKRHRLTVGVLTVLLFLVIAVTYFVLGGGGAEEKIELNNTAIEKARANMATFDNRTAAGTRMQTEAIQAARQSDGAEAELTPPETAAAEAPEAATPDAEKPQPSPAKYDDVIILPKSKVWLGVIDAQTHRRQTRTTDEPWRLDGSKTWLIVTGHGYLTLECGENNATYKQVGQMLFLYKDGRCREIDEPEFRSLNRGRVW
jgi:hypothetical protein